MDGAVVAIVLSASVLCVLVSACLLVRRRRLKRRRARSHVGSGERGAPDGLSSRQGSDVTSNGVSDSDSGLSNTRISGAHRVTFRDEAQYQRDTDVFSNPDVPSEFDGIADAADRVREFAALRAAEQRRQGGVMSPDDTLSLNLSASLRTLPQISALDARPLTHVEISNLSDAEAFARYTEMARRPEFASYVDATGVIPSLYEALQEQGVPADKLEASLEGYFEQILALPEFHRTVLCTAADMEHSRMGESLSSIGGRQPSSQVGLINADEALTREITDEHIVADPNEVHIIVTDHSTGSQ
eukprot:TRINITY_DN58795_c0_g1_i1.p1 TRINITY_DN58795_c0_g1~~TRINITY_DN58795_c0_g1_i1.p1  ORF type:complete len:301 (+),score=104.31 TRINITY_DN58795_c0_g1_i1:178-1080(+)